MRNTKDYKITLIYDIIYNSDKERAANYYDQYFGDQVALPHRGKIQEVH